MARRLCGKVPVDTSIATPRKSLSRTYMNLFLSNIDGKIRNHDLIGYLRHNRSSSRSSSWSSSSFHSGILSRCIFTEYLLSGRTTTVITLTRLAFDDLEKRQQKTSVSERRVPSKSATSVRSWTDIVKRFVHYCYQET